MQSSNVRTAPKTRKKIQTFFFNGALITICSIILRSIAVGFNVYVANVAGAEAVGLYTLLGGVYGFALTLALSGINLALTKLISEALALGKYQRAIKIIKNAAALALFFGVLSSILLFFGAEPISTKWLLEPRAERPLKILSVCLPVVALSSVFNGYFTAMRRAYKNAIAQLGEMTAKILCTVLLFTNIAKKDAELACIFLVFGSVFAEFCSFIINLSLYSFDRLKHLRRSTDKESEKGITKSILSISFPVALTSYVRSALLSIEHSLIPKGLYKFGANKADALSAYGTLTGMALPVINFPYALIGSFTSLLVPEVAESRAKGEKRHMEYITFRTYQSCLSFAFCVCGLFFAFSEHLGKLLYSSESAADYIRMLSVLVPVMYADTSTDAILKGLGEQVHCMKVNIADAVISVILVSLLVPRYGIIGYIVTIYIAEILNAAFSVARLLKVTDFKFPLKRLVLTPAFCAIGAGAIYNLIVYALKLSVSPILTVLGMVIFVLIYFILMNVTDALSDEDMRWFISIFK